MAFMFSATCSGRDAPVIAVDTLGFVRHQAMASWARVHLSSWAIGDSRRTFSILPSTAAPSSRDRSHS